MTEVPLDIVMDNLLKKLGDTPLPDALSHIDDAVLDVFAARQSEARATSRLLPLAGVLALGFGYAGGSFLPAPAIAADNASILAETRLAPSTLLDFL